ncbi:predicted protein [Histoplasma capsulatum H143]|uniref:Uncharacterized protein n=1 Tax=Ajellomyces capsulatus (strain H143) TaxID=544712 RepID=C6HEF5_AJECH|nr:predicted protein [Histoplasma capsulatum H143]
MHDAINTTVARDPLHLLIANSRVLVAFQLPLIAMRLVAFAICIPVGSRYSTIDIVSIIGTVIVGSIGIRPLLSLKQCHAETTRFENVHDMLDDFGGSAPALELGNVSFEGGVGAVGFRGHMDGEVMGAGDGLGCFVRVGRGSRYDTGLRRIRTA